MIRHDRDRDEIARLTHWRFQCRCSGWKLAVQAAAAMAKLKAIKVG